MVALLERQPQNQQFEHFLDPRKGLDEDYNAIYGHNRYVLGEEFSAWKVFEQLQTKNIYAIIGAQLGDEGKGRFVDNVIEKLSQIQGVELVYVIRFQGGSNAGHTVQSGDKKIALHQVPSMVFHQKAAGIMDRGMIIHPEDLQTEILYAEATLEEPGALQGRLFLSPEALLCTDLERAEEVHNRSRKEKAKGGTGRGMAPTSAHALDKTGVRITDLMDKNWEEILSTRYDDYAKIFANYGKSIADSEVPDFRASKQTGEAIIRTVGSKEIFLKRLRETREWLQERGLVQNTYLMHLDFLKDIKRFGIIFEGAQAVGLHKELGTLPDVTSTDTSVYGIQSGTAAWKTNWIKEKIGVFKATYMSSVGARQMPTQVDNEWSRWVQEEAHEKGTTTGRARDICHLDLAFMAYNCYMGGIEKLAATHLDIARPREKIKVCTHYTKNGEYVPYQPGLENQKGVEPHYIELNGWDGEQVKRARSMDQLPENARKYLAFIQARLGIPVIIATTGPKRENLIEFPREKITRRIKRTIASAGEIFKRNISA